MKSHEISKLTKSRKSYLEKCCWFSTKSAQKSLEIESKHFVEEMLTHVLHCVAQANWDMNYACAYTCKIDIGKEGAHLDLASTRPAPQLNLRLACEVFAFGTTGSPVKKGSRDGVFYSTTQPKNWESSNRWLFSHTETSPAHRPPSSSTAQYYTQPQIRCWSWKSDALLGMRFMGQ